MSIFCVVSTPWNIIKNAAGLLSFLSGYSCLMGPLAGILVTDFYIIRKGKLDIFALYDGKPGAKYWYTGGMNFRAFFSFVLGFAPTLPGFARAIGGPKKVHVGGAWKVCCEQMREER
jgi:NCS1 family nucleobase:cation symporter-1